MNIIDIVYNNQFVKNLYPNGIDEYALTHVSFDSFNNLELVIQIRQKPVKEIEKWGKWNKDYNVVSLTLTSNTLKKIDVDNWASRELSNCSCNIETYESQLDGVTTNLYNINFKGQGWSITTVLINLIYQRSSSYIL